MTAPRYVDCKCGHSHADHADAALRPQCSASGCFCLRYLPGTAPEVECRCGHGEGKHPDDLDGHCAARSCSCTEFRARPPGPGGRALTPVPSPPRAPALPQREEPEQRDANRVTRHATPDPADSLAALLHDGKASGSKRTQQLAEKIAGLVDDLRARMHDERQAAEAQRRRDAEAEAARREVADLEAKLAAAKARLRGTPPPAAKKAEPAPADEGDYGCPDCAATFNTPQGRGAHRAHAHGYRRTPAGQAS